MLVQRERERERENRSWLYFVEHDISDIYMSVLAVVCLCRERERENRSWLYFVAHDTSDIYIHVCVGCCGLAQRERETHREAVLSRLHVAQQATLIITTQAFLLKGEETPVYISCDSVTYCRTYFAFVVVLN